MIGIGKLVCPACDGGGYVHPIPVDGWKRCHDCDGVGQIWQPGGPRFGALLELGDRKPGEIVELATGDRARILWHMPRKNPDTTFVALFDPFDDTQSQNATPVNSRLGVVSVAARTAAVQDDLHDGEKDADAVDPIARRAREAGGEGPLL